MWLLIILVQLIKNFCQLYNVFLFQLVKLCIAMIDTGKAFCVANKQFMNGIRDLAQYSSNDAVVEVSIIKLSYNDQCNMLLNNYIYVPY